MQLLNIILPNDKNHSNIYKFKTLLNYNILYKTVPGDYCERVIPDPIPNSEVKPFCADGTLS